MVGWHHQLNGHEFEQTLGDSEGWGRGSLACCSSRGCRELDMTWQLNNNKVKIWVPKIINDCFYVVEIITLLAPNLVAVLWLVEDGEVGSAAGWF